MDNEENKDLEQTLVLIKPDALKNSLTGYMLSQLSEFHTGLRFAGIKVVRVTRMLAEEHYLEHQGKVFFSSLIEYLTGCDHYPDAPDKRRVIAMVYQGPDAIRKTRDIIGPTNPHVARETRPGCIRALGTLVPIMDAGGNVVSQRMDNLIHGSSCASDAEREVKLWFKPEDIPAAMRAFPTKISEEYYYFKADQLFTRFEAGAYCLAAPGDIMWKSDLEVLHLLAEKRPAPYSLRAVAAKYLINRE
ncbi:MAG: nucleoside-diphosphate kinase [Firmicutes bacterium]|nr:nucleoside-diphosphate kinase [Bacillota bacterium]